MIVELSALAYGSIVVLNEKLLRLCFSSLRLWFATNECEKRYK